MRQLKIKHGSRSSLHICLLLLISLLLMACRKQENKVVIGDIANNAVKILVNADGFYRVSLADLQNAGLTIDTLDSTYLRLTNANTAVPYTLSADHIIFYGQAPTNRYTVHRPYILTSDAAGDLMPETPVTPATGATVTAVLQTLHVEENRLYNAQAGGNDGSDLWFWEEIGQQQKVELSFNLVSLENNADATMRLQLWGVTQNAQVENDHDFEIVVNGQTIETIRWDGENHYSSETHIPAGILHVGDNTITLDNQVEGASFLDIMQINWLELDYSAPPLAVNDRLFLKETNGTVQLSGFSGQPLLFDITNTAQPQRLTEWDCAQNQACFSVNPEQQIAAIGPSGFLKPTITPLRQSDWANTANQADLLIITTDALAPGLTPLVQARAEQGLTAVVIPAAEIYDEFGYGEDSPDSIQTFIKYVMANWQTPHPRYVLLVGDATTDYRNYLGHAPANIIPPFMVAVEFSGETVSDTRLVDVNNDMKPELAVGRWPVDTLADVESLVRRTLAYEAGTAVNQALFATDDTEPQFVIIAEHLSQEADISADHVTILNGPTYSEVITHWNEGAWLTTYIGHGSVRRWGKDDVFNLDAVNDLKTSSPSIVIQLTCLSGLFAHPDELSLTEEMMRHRDGPVLQVAATSLTLSSNQEVFAQNLLTNLQDPGVERIGDAFQAAKLALYIDNNVGMREISDTFSLFGDPSTIIVRPKP